MWDRVNRSVLIDEEYREEINTILEENFDQYQADLLGLLNTLENNANKDISNKNPQTVQEEDFAESNSEHQVSDLLNDENLLKFLLMKR